MTLNYLDLTPAQRRLLLALPFAGNHLVDGPPGSGKSLLAAQRALMLALTGTPVVLLTRSNLLRQSLTPVVTVLGLPTPGVKVATAHSWLAAWYGPNAPRSEDGWYDWPAFYERAALTDLPDELSLVVDEGQDLPPAFYRLCRLLQVPTTVFADECQRLTDTQSTLAEIERGLGGCEHHSVDGNHRNTQQIAELAAHFHTGVVPPALPTRDGPPPRLHRLPNISAVTDLLISLAQKSPRQSIGVIVNSTHTQFELLSRVARRAPHIKPQMYTAQATGGRYRSLDLTRPGLVIVHRASAKGLGFDTVIVPDTETDSATDPASAALRMTYYVLATRARHALHLGYAGEREPSLLAGIDRQTLMRG
ncbi:DNA helicase [Streptomyces albipurpureus]|uniref:DNA helicase n=1 Tax=Streptomyces albipurpureus TaxID=2897419 RepID=A0ABT0UFY3_9ACTN|nr:DNA helicase [Streptomyces sp. CWNU-1]MCM2387314.1 DNA helicase [Streptomyces sp. CWNU-1]